MHLRLIAGTLFLLVAIPQPLRAAVILFTSESSFFAAAGSLDFEGFENTAPGQIGSSRILDGFILSDPGGSGLLEIINDPSVAAEGSQSVAGDNQIDLFAFNVAPTALGFTVFGFGDQGSNSLTLILDAFVGPGTVNLATIPLASSTDPFSAFRFFGVISTTPFDVVRIQHGNPDDFVAVDAVHFGTAVPEPSAGLLLAGALCALMARRAVRRSVRRIPTS